ncbi:MAG: hypothetical protein R3A78_04300 [Polyangiales bacterium]
MKPRDFPPFLRRRRGGISLEGIALLGAVGLMGVAGMRTLGGAYDDAIHREGGRAATGATNGARNGDASPEARDAASLRTAAAHRTGATGAPSAATGSFVSRQAAGFEELGRFARAMREMVPDVERLNPAFGVSDMERRLGAHTLLELTDSVWEAARRGGFEGDAWGEEPFRGGVARRWLASESIERLGDVEQVVASDRHFIETPNAELSNRIWVAMFRKEIDPSLVDELLHGERALEDTPESLQRDLLGILDRQEAKAASAAAERAVGVPTLESLSDASDWRSTFERRIQRTFGFDPDFHWFRYDPAGLPASGLTAVGDVRTALKELDPSLTSTIHHSGVRVVLTDLGRWDKAAANVPFAHEGKTLVANMNPSVSQTPTEVVRAILDFTARVGN